MSLMKNMSLRVKILLSFLPTVVVGILMAIIGIYGTSLISKEDQIAKTYNHFETAFAQAQIAHLNWLRTINNGLRTKSEKIEIGTDGHQCGFGKWFYGDDSGVKAAAKLNPELAEKLRMIEGAHLEIHILGGQLIELWNQKEFDAAQAIYDEKIGVKATEVLDTLNQLSAKSEELVEFHSNRAEAFQSYQMQSLLVVLIVGMAVAIPLALVTVTSLVRAIQQGVKFADNIGKGNVSVRLDLDRGDEIGILARDLDVAAANIEQRAGIAKSIAEGDLRHEITLASENDQFGLAFQKMIDSLHDSVSKLTATSEKVSTSSMQLSGSSSSLSQATQQDTGKIEEIVTGLAKVNEQTRSNATSAAEADHVAVTMKTVAAEGRTKMERMTESMNHISEGSNEIRKIIRVIDDIAFQTNLLALNAAVEAARAGQHGKGFAVVAEEVRNLAARSAKAAHETAELISQSILQVETGSMVAHETSESLNLITEHAERVGSIISQINTGSSEQAEGLQRINSEMERFNQGTATKLSNAEEMAAMALELSDMSETLHQIVTQFKV